jgi:adhesin transport system outer membrane protein
MHADLFRLQTKNGSRYKTGLSHLCMAVLLGQLMLLGIPAQGYAEEVPDETLSLKDRLSQKINNLQQVFQGTPPSNSISLSELGQYNSVIVDEGIAGRLSNESGVLPTIEIQATADAPPVDSNSLDLRRAIQIAVNRHPAIAQSLAQLSSEYSQVDIARAGYWPQVQAGVTTGRLGTSESGRQLLSLNATQVLYDFGKVRSNVEAEQANVDRQKAVVLKQIDDIALQTAEAIVNVRRYQELQKIAEQQVRGVARILEITQLRARAGISSQADPVQAQARYEGAQATLLQTETALAQWREKLRTLIGGALPQQVNDIPAALVQQARLYENPPLNTLPDIIVAESQRREAAAQRQNAHARRYPTLAIEGSVSRAIHGRNPSNTNEDDTYSSVMLALNSNLSQGGALSASERAAGYAEQAARARIQATYLDVTDQARSFREQILGAQRRLDVLADREQAIIQTRELYQEQYKLGTRTALDLLNSEQEIHLAATDRENTRYDIWNNVVNYIAITGRSRTVYGLNNTAIQGLDIQP